LRRDEALAEAFALQSGFRFLAHGLILKIAVFAQTTSLLRALPGLAESSGGAPLLPRLPIVQKNANAGRQDLWAMR
jgi:hypothetical protein